MAKIKLTVNPGLSEQEEKTRYLNHVPNASPSISWKYWSHDLNKSDIQKILSSDIKEQRLKIRQNEKKPTLHREDDVG